MVDLRRLDRVRSSSAVACAGLVALGALLAGCQSDGSGTRADPPPQPAVDSPTGETCEPAGARLASELSALERQRGGRVGVYAIDAGDGEVLGYRSKERFALASTVKALLAGAVLQELSRSELSRRLSWTEGDLVPHSPVTEQHVDDGLPVRKVVRAALTVSDNTAANLLFELVGGPAGLDRRLEQSGDPVTNVSRTEPGLNDFSPGDERDTTTPAAIARNLAAYAVGEELLPHQRRLLNRMLEQNTTGDSLIRAGVPDSWTVGDKTGSATYGTRNDVAVLRPPGRAPVVLAVLTRQETATAPADDVLVARAARIAVRALC